jgi:ligand-binding sensor domain-containing protein
MLRKQVVKMTMAAMAVAGFTFIGCSGDKSDDRFAKATPNMDSIARQIAFSPAESGVKSLTIDHARRSDLVSTAAIHDLAVADSLVVAALDDGVLTYDISQRTQSSVSSDQPVMAVAWHHGQAYVGGDKLYRIESGALVPINESLPTPVTSLYSYGPMLMVGTEDGLYAYTALGTTPLMEGIWVTSLVADKDGLWVGTDGQGLYRWDGNNFAKRYLARDSSLFDYVNCLDYGHDHLYMGTDSGLYVNDGGAWQTLTTTNGLPSDAITAIDASGWIVYVGTDAGIVTYFNDTFKPAKPLENHCATVIRHSSKGLLVGTETDGLLLQSGYAVRTLVSPKSTGDLATLVPEQ